MENYENKSVECRRNEHRIEFSELSFELALVLWLQWFCKRPFPDSTSFELKVLIEEQISQFLELFFELNFILWLQLFCKITFPDSDYFELKVLIVECATLESYENKNLLNVPATNREEHFQSFELALALWLQWYCKIPFPDSTFFELKVLIVECATSENYENKSVECRSKEHRMVFSELSFELALALWLQWFCKKHFQIQLLSNLKFW